MTGDDVESLLDELTLDEKLTLVHGTADPARQATGYLPGVDRLDVPPLELVDGPMGVRTEHGSATAFPASISLAASWNPSLAREQGSAMAREARAYDQDVLLGPGVNIVRTPYCGRNFEYYSEDPHLTARTAVGMVEGIQSEDVVATVKHYVANNQETNRYQVNVDASERALRELYLPAFRAAVEEADVGSVMTAYNRVNGLHMSDNRYLLSDVLKGEFGFDGFVVSDWWGTETTVGAATAGLDVEMPGAPFEDLPSSDVLPDDVDAAAFEFPDTLPNMHEGGLFGDPLREAIESGDVDEAVLDEKVRRLLQTMDRFGRLDGPNDEEQADDALDAPEHREIAHRVAVEGTVLLKNEGALPLDDDATLALVGPNADLPKLGGGGSSEVTPFTETTPVSSLRERAADLTFEQGVPRITETSLFDAFDPDAAESAAADSDAEFEGSVDDAVAAAAEADCAVVVVQDDTTESEDRESLRLPGQQDELVAAVADAADRTVVVVRCGGPVEMPWVDDVETVLTTWYAGQAEGDALAAVLYGDADPGGRLPITFGDETDFPTTTPERFPGVDDEVSYDEGVFVGYRHFDREDHEPLFPFGHGLSYTQFEYGAPSVETGDHEVTVSVPVENVGERVGSEVVQVYVRDDDPDLPRPERELRGYEKVHLEAGESATVELTLDRDAFAYYDDSDGWTVPAGPFTLLVGRSSRDIRGEVSVEVE